VTPITQALLNWKPVPLPRPVTLRGRTVTLEPLDAARHAGALWKAVEPPRRQGSNGDPEVRAYQDLWTWMPDGPFVTESDLRRNIEEKQAAAEAVFLAIVPAATGQAAGYASYMRMEPAHGVVEVGNVLFAPGLQHTTAATEAMYLMAAHVFDQLGYRRYEWKCNAENEPSRRAAQRLGFTFEGVFRQHMVVKGRNRDTAWFSMLDHEWPARKRAFEAWLAPANFDNEGRQRRSLAEIAAAQK
jgi:RimJ/RimL family protein N-acetyltransferase